MTNEDASAMRVAIQAASIARQYHDRLKTGHEPTEEAMREWAERAKRAADLWEETILGEPPKG